MKIWLANKPAPQLHIAATLGATEQWSILSYQVEDNQLDILSCCLLKILAPDELARMESWVIYKRSLHKLKHQIQKRLSGSSQMREESKPSKPMILPLDQWAHPQNPHPLLPLASQHSVPANAWFWDEGTRFTACGHDGNRPAEYGVLGENSEPPALGDTTRVQQWWFGDIVVKMTTYCAPRKWHLRTLERT